MQSNFQSLVFSCSQTAKLAQVSSALIRRMIQRGELKGIRVGKLWRIPRAEVSRLCGVKLESVKRR
jgi:excisionase family DNA binding protein